jgi:hypothetical protein
LNARAIVGFPERPAETPDDDGPATPLQRFDIADQLRQVRGAEIVRILDIAGGLSQRFGPDITVGFLFYEILGRPPDSAEFARQGERLRRSPSLASAIIEELLTRADAEPKNSSPGGVARDPNRDRSIDGPPPESGARHSDRRDR